MLNETGVRNNFGELSSYMREFPKIMEINILQDDLISDITLDSAKKYMRIDGNYEDDVLQIMLNACIKEVERLNNVSLTGKIIKVTFLGVFDFFSLELLPYPPVVKVLEENHFGGFFSVKYETEKSKDERFVLEVFNLMMAKYQNKGNEKPKKQIFI